MRCTLFFDLLLFDGTLVEPLRGNLWDCFFRSLLPPWGKSTEILDENDVAPYRPRRWQLRISDVFRVETWTCGVSRNAGPIAIASTVVKPTRVKPRMLAGSHQSPQPSHDGPEVLLPLNLP